MQGMLTALSSPFGVTLLHPEVVKERYCRSFLSDATQTLQTVDHTHQRWTIYLLVIHKNSSNHMCNNMHNNMLPCSASRGISCNLERNRSLDIVLQEFQSAISPLLYRQQSERAKNVHGRVIQGTKAALCCQALEPKWQWAWIRVKDHWLVRRLFKPMVKRHTHTNSSDCLHSTQPKWKTKAWSIKPSLLEN